MALSLALMAGAVEAGVGYPDILYRAIGHPVTWIGRLIAWADGRWNSEQDSATERWDRGVLLVAALVVLSVLSGLVIAWLCRALLPSTSLVSSVARSSPRTPSWFRAAESPGSSPVPSRPP